MFIGCFLHAAAVGMRILAAVFINIRIGSRESIENILILVKPAFRLSGVNLKFRLSKADRMTVIAFMP